MDSMLALIVLITIASTSGLFRMENSEIGGPPRGYPELKGRKAGQHGGRPGGPGNGFPGSGGPGMPCTVCNAKLEETEKNLEEANTITGELEAKLKDTEKELKSTEKALKAEKQNSKSIQTKLKDTEEKLESTKKELTAEKKNSTTIQAELEKTQKELEAEKFEVMLSKYELAVIEAEYGLPDAGGHVVYNTSAPLPNRHGVLVCQDIKYKFSCADGEKLKLIWANYGRIRKATCDYEPEFVTNSCKAPDAMEVVTKKCDLDNSAQSCLLNPGNDMFPTDPCPEVMKNLEVVFECVPK